MYYWFDVLVVKDLYEIIELKFVLIFEIFENDNDMELYLNYDLILFECLIVDMLVYSLIIMLENFV